MRVASVKKPGETDDEERAEDHRVFGLGLDADAVGALDVAAHDRPADADEEDHAGEIGTERVGLVRVAVQELQRARELVVELEQDRRDEQADEAEVDAGVHDARGRIAQQRLHPHAGAEVGEAALGVLAVGAAVVGCAAARSCGPAATRATRR